ncbi:23S rRNA (pseudouridine(1915)-N(3))-methyltransferase RlmH [Oceanobacillus sojae]|uniref:23S rRNA (pseudouridine(1915)-N(3))-methyltransferase RlmH n=1 Tax=Oceanobacillus sojae TaxID=582851 RepID=UPI003645EE15
MSEAGGRQAYSCSGPSRYIFDYAGDYGEDVQFGAGEDIWKNKVVFVVGRLLGISEDVQKRSDLALSFSRMIFPRQLIRQVLLE